MHPVEILRASMDVAEDNESAERIDQSGRVYYPYDAL